MILARIPLPTGNSDGHQNHRLHYSRALIPDPLHLSFSFGRHLSPSIVHPTTSVRKTPYESRLSSLATTALL
jgi:hypothetical protein